MFGDLELVLGVLLLLFATLFGFLIGRYSSDKVVYFIPFEELLKDKRRKK